MPGRLVVAENRPRLPGRSKLSEWVPELASELTVGFVELAKQSGDGDAEGPAEFLDAKVAYERSFEWGLDLAGQFVGPFGVVGGVSEAQASERACVIADRADPVLGLPWLSAFDADPRAHHVPALRPRGPLADSCRRGSKQERGVHLGILLSPDERISLAMAFGNIHQRPDLTTLFGELAREESETLTDALVALDGRLDRLAQEASEHVGVPYRNTALGFFLTDIAGGPSGEAGDIWFEIYPDLYPDFESDSYSGSRWQVDSMIIVFCDRELRGEIRGGSCTHELFSLTELAETPAEAVRLLADQIERLAVELKKLNPAQFRGARHEELD